MGVYIADEEEFRILSTATKAYERILTTALERDKQLNHKDDFDKRLSKEEKDEIHIELEKLRNFRQRLLDGEPAIKPS